MNTYLYLKSAKIHIVRVSCNSGMSLTMLHDSENCTDSWVVSPHITGASKFPRRGNGG